jgi:Cu(I)/Ag(I) efflux system membrane fusion protein
MMSRFATGRLLPAVFALCVVSLWGCGRSSSTNEAPGEHAHDAEAESHEEEAAGAAGVSLSKESEALAEITTEPAAYRESRRVTRATGEIEVNPRRSARIVSRVSGWVNDVRRIQGDHVRQGDVVLTIYSPEYQAASSEFHRARERRERARSRADSSEVATAQAIYESAAKRLVLLGESAEEIASLSASDVSPVVHVHSPFDGTILESHTVAGLRVEPGSEVCSIADLRTVWVVLDVFEQEITSVEPGADVTIRVAAHADEEFKGNVAFVDKVMDEATRTVKVRVEVSNERDRMKPGMFVEAEIYGRSERRALMVSQEAVQRERGEYFVFVREGDRFLRKDVETGDADAGRVEIVRGLSEGEPVVVRGAFLLKSEMSKAGFEAGHAH